MPKKEKSEAELFLKHLTGPEPDYKESDLVNHGAADLFEEGYTEEGGIVCRRRLTPDLMLYYGIMNIAGGGDISGYKVPFRAIYRFGEMRDAKAC